MKYPKKLVIATTNSGKLKEFEKLLTSLEVEIFSLKDFPEIGEIVEDGKTFAENALLKARTVSEKTGLVSLADDSGLEVDFLEGQPGVNSARFSGIPTDDTRNNNKLLNLLGDLPLERRTARFKCAIAIVIPDKREMVVEGICEGLILKELRGEGGFGYDPLFYLPLYDQTFAQLDIEIKNKISHRGQATKKAIGILREIFSSCQDYKKML
ncbi:MAG: XTP/dITP diphosphatase [Clostridia bacterium]|jgi:XTP/dITP diphosphohydrolase|nr:XTP/dITP diphosphatase [Clostridia bacterium]